jgi:hypothetical protein
MGAGLWLLFWLTVVVGGIVGWILNIVKLAEMCCEVSGMLLLRAAGILVAPLGAVLGWL